MKAAFGVAYFLIFGLAMIHGLVVAVRWWQGETLAQWEYGLLAICPVLIYLFITRYSIFKKTCTSCPRE
jgi:uncharacterized membrane protein